MKTYTIKESINNHLKGFSLLTEVRKSPNLYSKIISFFENASIYLNNELITDIEKKNSVSNECMSSLRSKIMSLERSKFNYYDFYVIKFSDFIIKNFLDPKSKIKISFIDNTVEKKPLFDKIDSFFVYIYQDTIFDIFPYSERDSDTKIEKNVKDFINSPEFDNVFGTATQRAKFDGEIIIRTIDRPIYVTTEYAFRTEYAFPTDTSKDTETKKTKRKTLKVNGPYYDSRYGSGVIKSITIKKETNNEIKFLLIVNFFVEGEKKINYF